MLNYIIITYIKGCIKLAMLTSQGSSKFNVPDYTKIYSVASSGIAHKDGYVYIWWWDCPSHSSHATIIINGVSILLGQSLGNYTFQEHKTALFPVSKGDVYQIIGDYIQTVKFIPLK